MAPIQFGWIVPPGANFAAQATRKGFPTDIRRALDRISGAFDSAWVVDHFQFDSQDVLECWTTLSYLAGLYPALRFGTAVLSQSYRNPALLAKMAATFQYLSEGRLILGIGAGWKEDEYQAYGYDFPPSGVRVDQLDEALQVINALWTDAPATFEGRYYRVTQAWCEPQPTARPPVMIGGKKPRMLGLAARHADWWNADWTGLADYRALVSQLTAACTAVGRDPRTLHRTWYGLCSCGPTEETAHDALNGTMFEGGAANALVGTPTQVVEQIRAFVELGVDYFMVCVPRFPDLTTLELLIDEVIPALNATGGDTT